MSAGRGASSNGDAGAVAARLARIRTEVAAACARSGRDVSAVTVLGASKRQPLARIAAAVEAGLETLGENRVQEAVAKSARLPVTVDWHLIGPLQSNKVKPAARLFSTVHSLDRPKIVRRLELEADRLGRRLDGFLQVNLGAEASKHGFAVTDTDAFADAVAPYAQLEHLRIVGLMAIPPYEADPERARRWFVRLRALRDELAARPEWRATAHGRWAGALSMGMSSDYAVAIEEGATHVRIGSALFGPRPEATGP